jgi:hypothetical protein
MVTASFGDVQKPQLVTYIWSNMAEFAQLQVEQRAQPWTREVVSLRCIEQTWSTGPIDKIQTQFTVTASFGDVQKPILVTYIWSNMAEFAQLQDEQRADPWT